MTGNQPIVFENVPSPFCGIASDDLKIAVSGVEVKILEKGDPVTRAGFESKVTDLDPRIGGQAATLEEAIARAAEWLDQARLPVFSGFGTDVNESRAALSLIERCRGVFDQARSAGGLRNLLVLADSGWMTTTLAEVRNRMDLLVVFGADIEAAFPRFFERFVWPEETLFGEEASRREVVIIGREPAGSGACSPDGRRPKVIPCDEAALPAIAAALSALAGGATLQAEHVGGVPLVELQRVVEKLQGAHYGVIAWVAGQLDFSHAELTVQQLCKTVNVLNRETRCAGLPLGGQDGDRTASQVAAWITGYPTRIDYTRGYPEYDPVHNSAPRLLAEGEADLLVWVSSLSLQPPPVTEIPTLVIGRSGMSFEREPDLFIPVGVPGIDFEGHLYRCDNVVSLPLYPLRDSGLPRAARVLSSIEQAMGES